MNRVRKEYKKRVALLCATPIELAAILARQQVDEVICAAALQFHLGTISGQPVVTVQGGVGKVLSAASAQALILIFEPVAIINVGVAGALSSDLRIGDLVLATAAVQHDFDTSPLGDPIGCLPKPIDRIEVPCDAALTGRLAAAAAELGITTKLGVIATGDQFIAEQGTKDTIVARFGARCCEMEGGAIASICHVQQIPCAILRTISDSADDGAVEDYPAFARQAADVTGHLLKVFFDQLNA